MRGEDPFMPTCSGTATITRGPDGAITSAILSCPAEGCPEESDAAKKKSCRGIVVPLFGHKSKGKDHLETDLQFCMCLTHDEADPEKHIPVSADPPDGCTLQLKLVYRVINEVRRAPIQADVYCSGSCSKTGGECPSKPLPKIVTDNGVTTETYTCGCVGKAK